MKKIIYAFLLLINIFIYSTYAQPAKEIRLLVRGDDIGSAHASNIACIESYKKGIMRSVEIMVPCAWFEEAAIMLNNNPELDVGIHLVLTSEWDNIKWRPVSNVPSLTDSDGYFHPRIKSYKDYKSETYLADTDWKIDEIEQEFRAQIEMALKKIPHLTHLSGHMGSGNWNSKVFEVYEKLSKEYNLNINPADYGVKRALGYEKAETFEDRLESFIGMLESLEAGTYIFIEHPGADTPEMRAMGHTGYFDVAADRAMVTQLFTSKKVMNVIKNKEIQLISYKDLKK